MIKLKLDILARKLGKNISTLAKETGLNRNTITALYHGNADGVRFDTLAQLCRTYGLKVEDVIGFEPDEVLARKSSLTYKQEGELIPFTCWPVGVQASALDKRFFNNDLYPVDVYWRKDYMEAFWPAETFNALAAEAYEKYKQPSAIDGLFDAYQQTAEMLESYYFAHDDKAFLSLSEDQFFDFFDRLKKAYARFWAMSLFIDSFDAGFDLKKIKDISERFKLSRDEVDLLTTPEKMTFNKERIFELLQLVAQYKRQKRHKNVYEFTKDSPKAAVYRKKFDYYKSNYAFIRHISVKEQVKEIEHWLDDEEGFRKNFQQLKQYSRFHSSSVRKLLKKKKLRENPLYFFQLLTYWREHRKQVNLMGIHLLFSVLEYLEQRSGIKQTYLKYITFDEVPGVLHGSVTQDVLKRRYEEGLFITFSKGSYKMVTGKEADSLKDQLNEKPEQGKVIAGQVASQGYARGKARIVLGLSDFKGFKEGEVLVTGMTRPEFLPLMKLAAAIVTNEGGITCHAAIVSRELGKPCIIGTKNATKLIKTGDLIEVRANHGTVRILGS